MKLQIALLLIITTTASSAYAQFSRQKINTDSSNIEIVRNSLYHIYEETYKNKDSVWYSVHFIKDTTRLNTEGWKRKNGKYVGVWQEYNFDKQLLYTMDHDNGTCEVNKALFPYFNMLENMKLKADSLITATYSPEFFNNHVRFAFNCYAYDKKGYVGSWTEPMTRKPTKFLFRYSVKLKTSGWYSEMIGIELDSAGNYMPSHDLFNNHGFEKVGSQKRTFQIDKDKAMQLAGQYGLQTTDKDKIAEFLNWESSGKAEFYAGRFRYYITEFTEEIKNINENARSSITYRYNVYSFDPWTGDFIEKKKMKNIRSWEKSSGNWSGLIPDND